jgi:putative inorganic carbon (hco3(-)) transporter
MNNLIPVLKTIGIILVFSAWIWLFSYSVYADVPGLLWILIGVAPVILLLGYLVYDPDIFLFAIIFMVPLSIKTDLAGGSAISFPAEFMAVLMLGYLVIHSGSIRIPDRKILTHPIFLALVAEICWLIIASGLSSIPLVSFKRTFIQILYLCIFYFVFLTRFDNPGNILKFYLFYAAGMVVPVIHGMIWHAGFNFDPQVSYFMPQPFFIEHTLYGAALAFIIPPLIYLSLIRNPFNHTIVRKVIFGLLLLLCLAAEFLAYSRAAWISLLVTPVFLIVFRLKIKPAFILGISAALVIISLLNFSAILDRIERNEAISNKKSIRERIESVSNIQSDISNLERINRWKCALRMFNDEPVKGYGPGTYQFIYGRYQLPTEMTRISTYHGEKGNAHSEYLGFLAETGVPGFILYLVVVFVTLSTAIRIIYRTGDQLTRNLAIVVLISLLTFLIHTLFNGFLDTDKIGSLFFGSLAAITALDVYFFRKEHV